ncbi:MAG: DNA repair protein RecO [Candidatus Vogelbacteria bacterium]|nr:DNA repair protein RecO [Candidatus Vogelbacteria bacterium]
MSRFFYHTDGLILGSQPVGESSRLFQIFTERLGRVTALAAGVRELKSKLRYSLTELNLVRFSLVRGRGVWRIVCTETIQPRFDPGDFKKVEPFKTDSKKLAAAARFLNLLSRLVVDEGRRANVWREAASAYEFLMAETFSSEALANFEILASLRILETLGYCELPPLLRSLAAAMPWQLTKVGAFTPHRQTALAIIEQALYHSHL